MQPPTQLTPMLRQYMAAKAECPTAILLFRMGDFFEAFFEDAQIIARELNLTLTSRDKSAAAVPMAGVPHHAVQGYIARLVRRGFNIALCDQVEDPRQAKGLVKRQITQLITPGTLADLDALEPGITPYLACVLPSVATSTPCEATTPCVVALLDLLAGELLLTEQTWRQVPEELRRMQVREVLCAEAALCQALQASLGQLTSMQVHTCLAPNSSAATPQAIQQLLQARLSAPAVLFEPVAAAAPAATTAPVAQALAAATLPTAQQRALYYLITYAEHTQKRHLSHLQLPRAYRSHDTLVLDEATRVNLELLKNAYDGQFKGSLLWHLDRTTTAMGARLLRRWLLFPLHELVAIGQRATAVERCKAPSGARAALRQALSGMRDIERLLGRLAMQRATPRDVAALRDSLACLPALRCAVQDVGASDGIAKDSWHTGNRGLATLPDVLFDRAMHVNQTLQRALVPQPPSSTQDGGIFALGYCTKLDELLHLSQQGHGFLTALEKRERQRTNIASLKVRYNRVFGYYLEIPSAHLAHIPADYSRKQTLANAERFVTEELKNFEQKVLYADDKRKMHETQLFVQLCHQIQADLAPLRQLSQHVAEIDALQSLAEVAATAHYSRPHMCSARLLELEEARHPVLERLLPSGERFVPNDLCLQETAPGAPAGRLLMLVTGPNMAGKSTVMRQAALCVVLAHMGSFVPARQARIGLCDRLFTRVGASDNLTRGHSTFMVEMLETATILAQATPASLILLDEIGRGTSTHDGLAIATAVAEYLHDVIGCRTLFATHYHELCQLSATHRNIVNAQMAVARQGKQVVFLRRLIEGAAQQSYGIEVARLAGLPEAVLQRATTLLHNLKRTATPLKMVG